MQNGFRLPYLIQKTKGSGMILNNGYPVPLKGFGRKELRKTRLLQKGAPKERPCFGRRLVLSSCSLLGLSGFADGTEELHLFLDGGFNGLHAGSEYLSGVEALALKVLACFDVLSCSCRESELALGVNVNL